LERERKDKKERSTAEKSLIRKFCGKGVNPLGSLPPEGYC